MQRFLRQHLTSGLLALMSLQTRKTFGTQIKIFLMHSESSLTLHRQHDFIQQFASSASPFSAILESITYLMYVHRYIVYVQIKA